MGYKFKAVVIDHVFADLSPSVKALNDVDCDVVVLPKGASEDQIMEATKDADAVLLTYFELKDKFIENMTKCKVITRTGIGVNNIDVDVATKKGIKVAYVPDYCIDEVADHALALIMSCARGIVDLNNNIKGGNWAMDGAKPLFRFRGRKLGLLGFGRIAQSLCDKMKPLGVEVLAFDPFLTADKVAEKGAKKVEIDELFSESDYISLHAPLTKDTANIVNAENLKLAKKDLIIVNTSRGGLIDEKALFDALSAGKIAKAGLDVLASEVFDPKNPLVGLKNVILTPHAGYYSEQSTIELRDRAFDEVLRGVTGQAQRCQFNKV